MKYIVSILLSAYIIFDIKMGDEMSHKILILNFHLVFPCISVHCAQAQNIPLYCITVEAGALWRRENGKTLSYWFNVDDVLL